jgi:AraC-like DNA-binding protein
MAYREHAPDGALGRWVECAWSIETEAPVSGWPVRPDGCLDILYSHAGLEVVGAMTAQRGFDLPAGTRTAGLRFRPGMAARFLGVAAEQLTDHAVNLEDLWGAPARALTERLAGAGSADECRRVLTAGVPAAQEPPEGVHRALEAIGAAHGAIDLDWVARQAGMSARQFRRRCLEESGLTPKHLCRVLRFRRACALGGHGLPWGLVAAETGYFDQAHLIRDFREFTGATPVSVFYNTGHADRP